MATAVRFDSRNSIQFNKHIPLPFLQALFEAKCNDLSTKISYKLFERFLETFPHLHSSSFYEGMPNERYGMLTISNARVGSNVAKMLYTFLKDDKLESPDGDERKLRIYNGMNLSKNVMKLTGAIWLSKLLRENTSILTLDLRANYFRPKAFEILFNALEHNNTLLTLDMSSISGYRVNQMGELGAKAVTDYLALPNTALTTLRIAMIGALGAKTLVEMKAFENNQTLTSLDLGWNAYGKDDELCLALLRQLRSTKLTSLSLQGNAMRTQLRHNNSTGIGEELAMISRMPTLTSLNLSHNQLSAPFLDYLIPVLGKRKITDKLSTCALRSLVLDGNVHLTGIGVSHMVKALQHNETLLSLSMAGCGITDEYAIPVASLLRKGSVLQFLELSENYLQATGFNAILESLQKNTTLRSLGLAKNHIDDGCATNLATFFRSNEGNCLYSLDLSGNNITDNGMEIIMDGLYAILAQQSHQTPGVLKMEMNRLNPLYLERLHKILEKIQELYATVEVARLKQKYEAFSDGKHLDEETELMQHIAEDTNVFISAKEHLSPEEMIARVEDGFEEQKLETEQEILRLESEYEALRAQNVERRGEISDEMHDCDVLLEKKHEIGRRKLNKVKVQQSEERRAMGAVVANMKSTEEAQKALITADAPEIARLNELMKKEQQELAWTKQKIDESMEAFHLLRSEVLGNIQMSMTGYLKGIVRAEDIKRRLEASNDSVDEMLRESNRSPSSVSSLDGGPMSPVSPVKTRPLVPRAPPSDALAMSTPIHRRSIVGRRGSKFANTTGSLNRFRFVDFDILDFMRYKYPDAVKNDKLHSIGKSITKQFRVKQTKSVTFGVSLVTSAKLVQGSWQLHGRNRSLANFIKLGLNPCANILVYAPRIAKDVDENEKPIVSDSIVMSCEMTVPTNITLDGLSSVLASTLLIDDRDIKMLSFWPTNQLNISPAFTRVGFASDNDTFQTAPPQAVPRRRSRVGSVTSARKSSRVSRSRSSSVLHSQNEHLPSNLRDSDSDRDRESPALQLDTHLEHTDTMNMLSPIGEQGLLLESDEGDEEEEEPFNIDPRLMKLHTGSRDIDQELIDGIMQPKSPTRKRNSIYSAASTPRGAASTPRHNSFLHTAKLKRHDPSTQKERNEIRARVEAIANEKYLEMQKEMKEKEVQQPLQTKSFNFSMTIEKPDIKEVDPRDLPLFPDMLYDDTDLLDEEIMDKPISARHREVRAASAAFVSRMHVYPTDYGLADMLDDPDVKMRMLDDPWQLQTKLYQFTHVNHRHGVHVHPDSLDLYGVQRFSEGAELGQMKAQKV